MCGIFGYVGSKNSAKITLSGLKKLEYRGYDSAGIASIKNHEIILMKEAGKVSIVEQEVEKAHLDAHISIAHTRWATHGKPTKVNAHPHLDEKHTIACVHNGIIENYDALKKSLISEGVRFISDTDTEVIPHLVAKFYEGNFLEAVQKTLPLLKGAFAIALIHKDHPNEIIAVGQQAPLVIGMGPGEMYLASDAHALALYTKEVIYLSHGEIAVLRAQKLEVYDSTYTLVDKKVEKLLINSEEISKGAFQHYTLKEIYEQPNTLRSAMAARFNEEMGTAIFDSLNFDPSELHLVERILILGCGTSWHAGFLATYLFEELAYIPTQVEISSEFRYKNPVISAQTLVIAISQSGETADTLAAVRELKAKGTRVLGVCNVLNSTLAREADGTLFLRAGPEIGVCSTKAFTSQVTVLSLFALMLARMRHVTKEEGEVFLTHLKKIPDQVQRVLDQAPHIESVANKFANYENFFFLGRNYMYPTCLEGALKLKEISYINANGYPAGELKHGPIALINNETPTVALMANKATLEKMMSNLQEVKAREGKIIAIIEEGMPDVHHLVDEVIVVPKTIDALAPLLTTVVCQLLAYDIARVRGCDIDQPRNLAKSVTVE